MHLSKTPRSAQHVRRSSSLFIRRLDGSGSHPNLVAPRHRQALLPPQLRPLSHIDCSSHHSSPLATADQSSDCVPDWNSFSASWARPRVHPSPMSRWPVSQSHTAAAIYSRARAASAPPPGSAPAGRPSRSPPLHYPAHSGSCSWSNSSC